MAKIKIEFETLYEKGDVVVFEKNGEHGSMLQVGVIEGYYLDRSACNSVGYNVRINKDFVYSYTNCGDIGEFDILMKIDANDNVKNHFIGE